MCSIIKLATHDRFDGKSSYWSAPKKAPNFSAFHWSPYGCLITIGQHYVTTRVVHLPKRTETSLITNRTKAELITSDCSYARSTQPGPIRAVHSCKSWFLTSSHDFCCSLELSPNEFNQELERPCCPLLFFQVQSFDRFRRTFNRSYGIL